MATDKRKIQEINAGSMADIAFLLLIFFLVATTMNTDTGLVRMLPPMPPEDQPQDEIKVKERNLFLVFINGRGEPQENRRRSTCVNSRTGPKSSSSIRWMTRTCPRRRTRTLNFPTAASGYIP